MIPYIAKTGVCFNGALKYYCHDKKDDVFGPFPETSNRVAWIEYRNLFTKNPKTAGVIMSATAGCADHIKREAGIKLTGRQSRQYVYHYSLSWCEADTIWLTKDDMVWAADQSIKALRAEHLQSVIICHTDKSHPHVHIVMNRVDPFNGKLHNRFRDRTMLWEWADDYRLNIEIPKRFCAAEIAMETKMHNPLIAFKD